MNEDERDVVSSVGSAVVASVAMVIFCASAGLPPEITVKGALLLGTAVSAAHLVRHGFLLAIAHKFGPVGESAAKHWLKLQVDTEAEAKAFWREMANREIDAKEHWKQRAEAAENKWGGER
jgi:hypothetical protein